MFKKSYFLFITAPVWFLGIIKTNAPVPTILFLWLIKVYTCIVGLPVWILFWENYPQTHTCWIFIQKYYPPLLDYTYRASPKSLNHIHLLCTLDTHTHSIFVNYQHLQVQSILLGYSYQKKLSRSHCCVEALTYTHYLSTYQFQLIGYSYIYALFINIFRFSWLSCYLV